MLYGKPGTLVMKSLLIISHFYLESFILLAKPLGLWYSSLTFWQSGHLRTNFARPSSYYYTNTPLPRHDTSLWKPDKCKIWTYDFSP